MKIKCYISVLYDIWQYEILLNKKDLSLWYRLCYGVMGYDVNLVSLPHQLNNNNTQPTWFNYHTYDIGRKLILSAGPHVYLVSATCYKM